MLRKAEVTCLMSELKSEVSRAVGMGQEGAEDGGGAGFGSGGGGDGDLNEMGRPG